MFLVSVMENKAICMRCGGCGNCGGPKRNVSDPVVYARVDELCIRLPESGVKITNEITWQPQRGAILVLERRMGLGVLWL